MCLRRLLHSQFGSHKLVKDGLNNRCRECLQTVRLARSRHSDADTKECADCGLVLSSDSFWRDVSRPDGRADSCVACYTAYRADPARSRARQTSQLLACSGSSFDFYSYLLVAQCGRCCMCEKPMLGEQNCQVDHAHTCCPGRKSCGKCVRGLLCRQCNLALGMLRDDPSTLRRALGYLEHNETTWDSEGYADDLRQALVDDAVGA